MRKVTSVFAALLAMLVVSGCEMLGTPSGALKATEVATTVANLDPLFERTELQVKGNWESFSAEEKVILESSYRQLLTVRDTVKVYVDGRLYEEAIIDLATADLLYAQVKDAYVDSRDVIHAKLATFSYTDQALLLRLDRRMANLDLALQELKKEGEEADVTPKVMEILRTAAVIIQTYRMAKDPLGLTYADR